MSAAVATVTELKTPRWALPLLQPARYKGAHGGRGGGKSHFFAELFVERCITDPNLRAVNIREVLKSIALSSKQLIEDKIREMNVGYYFDVQNSVIKRHGGNGLMAFAGMQDHTADSIKSLEKFGLCWVEEAQSLSARSMELLLPTFRADGSEIWFGWNPYLPTDPVEKLMRGPDKDPDAVTVQVNYTDNPFLPDTLRREAEKHRERSPQTFARIWLGAYANNGDDVVIPLDWVMRAVKRWRELKDLGEFDLQDGARYRLPVGAIGVDVADQGEDKTVIAPRINYWVPKLDEYQGKDTMQVADLCGAWKERYPQANQLIDAIGIGAGVVSQARRKEARAVPFIASQATDRKDRHGILSFRNLRAAAWWNLRDILDPAAGFDVALPDDDELVEELTTPRWIERNGKVQVESKEPTENFPDGIRARLGRSPDKATAVIQAFWIPEGREKADAKPDVRPQAVKDLEAARRGALPRNRNKYPTPTRL